MLNEQQVLSGIRWILATGGAFLTAHGYASESMWTFISGVVIEAVPFAWSMFRHTRVGTLIAAAEVPGTQKIVTSPEMAQATPSSKVVSPGG